MRLRTTAGAYAGEVREYSPAAGLAALRSGMAEPVDAMPRVIQTDAAARAVTPLAPTTRPRLKGKRSETTAA